MTKNICAQEVAKLAAFIVFNGVSPFPKPKNKILYCPVQRVYVKNRVD